MSLDDIIDRLDTSVNPDDDFGPYFWRDLCNVIGIDYTTDLDLIMNRIKEMAAILKGEY
jgi:hypothetical protein